MKDLLHLSIQTVTVTAINFIVMMVEAINNKQKRAVLIKVLKEKNYHQ